MKDKGGGKYRESRFKAFDGFKPGLLQQVEYLQVCFPSRHKFSNSLLANFKNTAYIHYVSESPSSYR